MSVAFDHVAWPSSPGVSPVAARRPLADVITLAPPSRPAGWRLTVRGVRVLALGVLALACLIVAVAARSAPDVPAPGARVPAGVTITVRPGDTLWDIATRVAPDRDPRDEVAALERANGLRGPTVHEGDQLRVP